MAELTSKAILLFLCLVATNPTLACFNDLATLDETEGYEQVERVLVFDGNLPENVERLDDDEVLPFDQKLYIIFDYENGAVVGIDFGKERRTVSSHPAMHYARLFPLPNHTNIERTPTPRREVRPKKDRLVRVRSTDGRIHVMPESEANKRRW